MNRKAVVFDISGSDNGGNNLCVTSRQSLKSWQMNHVLTTAPLPFLTSATHFLPMEQQGTDNLK